MIDYACPRCFAKVPPGLELANAVARLSMQAADIGIPAYPLVCRSCEHLFTPHEALNLDAYVPPPKPPSQFSARFAFKFAGLLALSVTGIIHALGSATITVDTKRDSWSPPPHETGHFVGVTISTFVVYPSIADTGVSVGWTRCWKDDRDIWCQNRVTNTMAIVEFRR